MCIKVWYGIRQHALCEFPGTIWYFPAPILFFEQPQSFEAKHTYHIFYFKMSARKYDGIWRCSNRQHESERARNGSRKHKVPGMNTNFFSLRIETKLFRVMKSLWLIHNFYVYVCVDWLILSVFPGDCKSKYTLTELTNEARIGRKIVAVAVFEVTSVNVVIITHTIMTIA